MGGGGVKNYQKLRDVIYGRPLTQHYKVDLTHPNFHAGSFSHLTLTLAGQCQLV